MDFLTVLEPSSLWKIIRDESRDCPLLISTSEPTLQLEVGASFAPASEQVFEFLSEKVFASCESPTDSSEKVCVLLLKGTRRSAWAERTILDKLFTKLGSFGSRVVDLVAVAVNSVEQGTPSYTDLVLGSWKACAEESRKKRTNLSFAAILDKVVQRARSAETQDVDCIVYQLIVEGINEHPSTVITFLCVPPAKSSVLKKVILWYELSRKRSQDKPETKSLLRKVVFSATHLYCILYVDDSIASVLLPFIDSISRRLRCLMGKPVFDSYSFDSEVTISRKGHVIRPDFGFFA
jgi:hypothetical protein